MIHSLLRSSTARVGSVALLALIVCGLAFAALTGSMTVTVTDKDGAPLPGATVKITGSSQLGERAAVTNDKGVVQFNAVTPGTYTVQVTMAGFATINRPDVPVKLDQHSQVKLQMLEEKVEAITVTGKTPTVDTQSTSTGTELSRQLVDSVPIPRDYLGNLSRVPGVGTGSNPSVRGATERENMYLIDGVNTTDPVTSTFGTNINFEIIDQQQVTTGGLGVEYGGVSGMVSNVITKSGGNNWSGTLTYFRQDPRWEWSPKPDVAAGTSALTYNYAYTLGGPIIKDKLWHFTSYQKNLTEYTYLQYGKGLTDNAGNPRAPRQFDGYLPFAKLTWQATPNHRLQAIHNQEQTTIYNVNATTTYVKPEQFYQQDQPSKLYSLKYTGVLGSNLILEGQLNFHRQSLTSQPQHNELGPNTQGLFQDAGHEFGRYSNFQTSDRNRDEIKLDLSYFIPSSFGDHNLKIGVSGQKTSFKSANYVSGYERFVDWTPAATVRGLDPSMAGLFAASSLSSARNTWRNLAYYNGWTASTSGSIANWTMTTPEGVFHPGDFTFSTLSQNPEAAGEDWTMMRRYAADPFNPTPVGSKLFALYGQDEWKYGNLSVRAGVRVDRQQFLNSDDRTEFKFQTNVSPRVGVTYDPKGDGKSKIWGSFGILYDQLNDEMSDFVGNRNSQRTFNQYYLEPLGGWYNYYEAVSGLTAAIVAPNVRNPRTKEFMIGYARDLGNELGVEFTAFNRNTTDLVEDWDVTYGNDTTYQDPLNPWLPNDEPRLLTYYPQLEGNPTLAGLGFKDVNGDGVIDLGDLPVTTYSPYGSEYVIYNPPGAKRNAYGFDVVINKRFANNWQGMLSYEYQKATGTVDTAILARSVGDNPFLDPRLSYNNGPLPYSREHFLQAMASYTFKNRLTVGGEFRMYSGNPYSLSVTDPLNWSSGVIWNGDPSAIINSLGIDREEFAAYLGIPSTIPDPNSTTQTGQLYMINPALDKAILGMVPFELKAGRGQYRQPWVWATNLRIRYDLPVWKKVQSQFFVDIFNVTNRQAVTSSDGTLAAKKNTGEYQIGTNPETGEPIMQSYVYYISPNNIGDRNAYYYNRTLSNQAPRTIQAGVRVQF